MSHQLYSALRDHFKTLEAELNALDAATGDGDHGSTMLKGLEAVVVDSENPAKAFRRAAGGASGSLFSVVVAALDSCWKDEASIADALTSAADRIHALGQAEAGDKTMLDALLPASKAGSVSNAVSAAFEGAKASISMPAQRGRAKYVEGKGVGHMDAGARSVAEMLDVFAQCKSAL